MAGRREHEIGASGQPASRRPSGGRGTGDDEKPCALAPVRVNLIAAGFVGPADIAALAIHLMTNAAVTGATFDIDGGQQLI